ncbi:hypothetical protein HF319_19420, partial [Xanthomonas sp. Kuri4-1]
AAARARPAAGHAAPHQLPRPARRAAQRARAPGGRALAQRPAVRAPGRASAAARRTARHPHRRTAARPRRAATGLRRHPGDRGPGGRAARAQRAPLALSFRIALATLDGRQAAVDSTRQLAWLAESVVQAVLALARQQLQASHGGLPGGAFAIIGYGSLGGLELGFGSDLDLVFLYDAPAGVEASDGARPLETGRWFARLAQKVMALLGAETGAGRLYDIDVRLRPDGGKGALVSSLASYRDYQRERAWTWEHQALV